MHASPYAILLVVPVSRVVCPLGVPARFLLGSRGGKSRSEPDFALSPSPSDQTLSAASPLPPATAAAAEAAAMTVAPFLSVRTAFDLYLKALDLPRGSRVVCSALTIPDMVTIFEAHGLVLVPVDLDPDTLAPEPGALEAEVERCGGGDGGAEGADEQWRRVRAIYVAHVFGAQVGCCSLDLGVVCASFGFAAFGLGFTLRPELWFSVATDLARDPVFQRCPKPIQST